VTDSVEHRSGIRQGCTQLLICFTEVIRYIDGFVS
jgi:hypothetical protein